MLGRASPGGAFQRSFTIWRSGGHKLAEDCTPICVTLSDRLPVVFRAHRQVVFVGNFGGVSEPGGDPMRREGARQLGRTCGQQPDPHRRQDWRRATFPELRFPSPDGRIGEALSDVDPRPPIKGGA